MNANTIQAMKDIDIRTVDPATLIDIADVLVKPELPKNERIRDFICQIKNPYCFRVGKVAVKLSFTDCGTTLEDRLESLMINI